MHILISNDDGIQARGLQTLRRILEPVATITVVAPERQRSAMGHAITMHKPLYAKPAVYGPNSRGWRVNGTPADCVKLGIGALAGERPDLVLSGINHGTNLGRDVFYSGTVSAAMEAMFLGVPAIALSLEDGENNGFEWVARFVRWWIGRAEFQLPPPGIVYNVNFPSLSRGRPRLLRVVKLGQREYANDFQKATDPRGREYFWIAGDRIDNLEDKETDVAQHHLGAITLTPLHMHLTAESLLERIPDIEVPVLDGDPRMG
ncbi:5'/3'-nucleotidase SurE [Sulfobacillus harzensis]|uniref:5'-nucleotidase SurE n=1 Tax=Sulfobacillus harzensis TaxID=2729629 RepID=A0A7Y0Q2V4_9FIRM|nr:5'/3'-nucleotidase SurE [Sulfobacillus harzensis]NMP22276.1 5'/3'-nucleotidase SurE [Sulfobacillus harzensis]